jgi:hypothetical protein
MMAGAGVPPAGPRVDPQIAPIPLITKIRRLNHEDHEVHEG